MAGTDEHRRQGLSPRVGENGEAGEIWKKETGHGDEAGGGPAPFRQRRAQLIDRRRSGPYGEPERLYPRSVVR